MARNRNRQAGPIKRNTITIPDAPATMGTNPALRVQTRTAPLRSVDGGLTKRKRTKAVGPGAVARDSRGNRSAWSMSPYYTNGVTVDARWSATVSS